MPTIKAITLWQPYATLMALGHKRIETRSWPTQYRGPLAIHAAKRVFIPDDPQEQQALTELGINPFELPVGCVVGVCRLVGVTQIDSTIADSKLFEYYQKYLGHSTPHEILFGDYSIGRFLWLTDGMIALPEPIRCAGKQGLWNWEVPEGVRLP